jgi:hypothetical protein
MNIKEKKKRILNWSDFYGGDIIDESMVKKAKSNNDLKNALNRHAHYIETMAIDAQTHLNQFKKDLGL